VRPADPLPAQGRPLKLRIVTPNVSDPEHASQRGARKWSAPYFRAPAPVISIKNSDVFLRSGRACPNHVQYVGVRTLDGTLLMEESRILHAKQTGGGAMNMS
jgi:hypothetical protein